MTDKEDSIDWQQIEEFFAEQQRWAGMYVTIDEIAQNNNKLVRDLAQYDPKLTIPMLAGLLTLPNYQTQCVRLETLVALAVTYCQGRKKPHIAQAVRWYFEIGKSNAVLGEDEAEDVFVSLLLGSNRDYRLLEGLWEAAGFYTQRVYDVVRTMPDSGHFAQIKRSIHALLVVSDIVCDKSGLTRYQLGSDERRPALLARDIPGRNGLISRVSVSFAELQKLGISQLDLQPFFLLEASKRDLPSQQVGHSQLDRHPLIPFNSSGIAVALPTALSVALRDFVIETVIDGGLIDSFDQALADNYSHLFSETPLLGGPTRAPLHWQKAGVHRFANFAFEVDEGYVISYHVFLPSVGVHPDGGFKDIYVDDGTLTMVLQKSIDHAVSQHTAKPHFKRGTVVVIGCGWGKGYATEVVELDHPQWRYQSMSVADLIRLSWLGNMSPAYFWRIQDGLEAVENAGVTIVNPNGIINLIGWVRRNEGHFVPHGQLPGSYISPDEPLMLNPPLNLLREVRADSDHGYDRHCAIDTAGHCHEVQHISPTPFFTSESAARLYASMTDVKQGMLTSLYEGTHRLWATVSAPNMADQDAAYRLWEMINQWLHRIGWELDAISELGASKVLKIYVEFRDGSTPETPGEKPDIATLANCCRIEQSGQPSSLNVIFSEGFIDGFRIAENVAERLVVLTVTEAFMRLFGVPDSEKWAKDIEQKVVPNDDARSFHLFHAQGFIDYARDTLPRELVGINNVDDGVAKLGLAWRVRDPKKGNHIQEQSACTKFLNDAVDILVKEIKETLGSVERRSTLQKLVRNIEKASSEEDHWRRTSAAVLGLHGNVPDTREQYVREMSKIAASGIASRVLAEMALCVCPGHSEARLSDIELSKLLARVLLIVRLGGMSDAIYYNALSPEITLSPLGDILFRDDFGRVVVEPMLSEAMGQKFVSDAPLQAKQYDEPKVVSEAKGQIDPEFWDIWNREMGFTLDEARRVMDALDDRGVQEHNAVLELKTSDVLSMCLEEGVSNDVAKKFLNRFSLPYRQRWEKLPNGFDLKDIYPWRYGRKLSFVTRPILQLDRSDDPELLIPPHSLRRGFIYVVDGAYNGRLEQSFFLTTEMRDYWWGKAREGHTFNSKVARAMSEAGWEVRENIGLPEILNEKLDKDYGDVDVFAWREDRNDILVMECKDLAAARNYSEIAALLSDYQGREKGGEPDALLKHLNRVDILNSRVEAVRRFIGKDCVEIVSCLCCNGIVPMQYAQINALSGTKVGSMEEMAAL